MKNREDSDKIRLGHILEAIEMIQEFVQEISKEEFLENNKIQSAVLYQFIIIGEAVSSLSMETTEQNQYPWHKPRAFRNFLAHEYFGIKMWMVWNAIIVDLPQLKIVVMAIISTEN
jgi:uncharacterized protein with HEPN domain